MEKTGVYASLRPFPPLKNFKKKKKKKKKKKSDHILTNMGPGIPAVLVLLCVRAAPSHKGLVQTSV